MNEVTDIMFDTEEDYQLDKQEYLDMLDNDSVWYRSEE